jgi:pimeloyl-ACP methyl ester carboxylesterase
MAAPGTIERRIGGTGLELLLTERGSPQQATVVLVHGFPDTSAVWDPVADRLAEDFHVVTFDVRGAGGSDAPSERAAYALPRLVDDIEAVINATSPDRPVHLVAHDWGSIQCWEAVVTARLAGRFASYTSISGPPLDHAGLWTRRHRTRQWADLKLALRQAVHSLYILYFHLPYLPELMTRGAWAQRLWVRALRRMEGVPNDDRWPASTFSADFAHGVELYRANVRTRMRHPTLGHASCPVQLIIPLQDRYVLPALLDGLEEWADVMWRREVPAGHWVVRTHPDEVCEWIREVAAYVDQGTESSELQRTRVA